MKNKFKCFANVISSILNMCPKLSLIKNKEKVHRIHKDYDEKNFHLRNLAKMADERSFFCHKLFATYL